MEHLILLSYINGIECGKSTKFSLDLYLDIHLKIIIIINLFSFQATTQIDTLAVSRALQARTK